MAIKEPEAALIVGPEAQDMGAVLGAEEEEDAVLRGQELMNQNLSIKQPQPIRRLNTCQRMNLTTMRLPRS